jgi:uncharacterized protein YegP (UPF0339 family)
MRKRRTPDDLEFYKADDGLWRWRTVAPNNRITGAASQGFTRKQDARRAYRDHIANAPRV